MLLCTKTILLTTVHPDISAARMALRVRLSLHLLLLVLADTMRAGEDMDRMVNMVLSVHRNHKAY